MGDAWAVCCDLAPAVLSRDWVRVVLANLPVWTLAALYVIVADEWEG